GGWASQSCWRCLSFWSGSRRQMGHLASAANQLIQLRSQFQICAQENARQATGRPAIGGEVADERWGAAHCGEYRQAAGASAQELMLDCRTPLSSGHRKPIAAAPDLATGISDECRRSDPHANSPAAS